VTPADLRRFNNDLHGSAQSLGLVPEQCTVPSHRLRQWANCPLQASIAWFLTFSATYIYVSTDACMWLATAVLSSAVRQTVLLNANDSTFPAQT
jgi:hypothetical protein